VLEIGFKCAQELDYAHRRGTVHRDIKPSNVMLTPEDDVKINGFGIAQRMQLDITQVLGIVGSPIYMSPEQARENNIDQRTDLYSLGSVLFESLCGRPPFEAARSSRLIYQITNEKPPSLTSLRAAVPEPLAVLVAKALEKDPAQRCQTGLELAIELARIGGRLGQLRSNASEDSKFDFVRTLSFFNEFSDQSSGRSCARSGGASANRVSTSLRKARKSSQFLSSLRVKCQSARTTPLSAVLARGDCSGEMGYLSNMKRTADIIAETDVTLLEIDAATMERASAACQLRFNKMFLQTLIERLVPTSEELSKRGAEPLKH